MANVLNEQIDYYRARAAEYDEWFYRQGRYDRDAESNQKWFDEAAIVRDALLSLPKQGHILELAAGTGIWTQELVKLGEKITVVDAAPEMIEIHKAKLQSDKIDYVQADLFEWQPSQSYDMIFFGFWLSHVPPEKLDDFLAKVSTALKPNGIVFMVDSRRTPNSTAKDHQIPDTGTQLERKLNDGRKFQIVKIFYERESLEAAFLQEKIAVNAKFTDNFFIYVQGHKESTS